jgi:hypothetical protein
VICAHCKQPKHKHIQGQNLNYCPGHAGTIYTPRPPEERQATTDAHHDELASRGANAAKELYEREVKP